MTARTILAGMILWATAQIAVAASPEGPPGAASCTGCHPAGQAVETPVPRLIGRTATEITAAMQGFRSGKLPTTIMDRIAKGFSDEESRIIAAWYGEQRDCAGSRP
ncbi:MAG: cytochrome C [Proteobacteria bacterium]|nr:cytochrome C [Pseudomonadota bacterium]